MGELMRRGWEAGSCRRAARCCRVAAETGANAVDRADAAWRFRIALSIVLLLACVAGGLSSLTSSASAACANESFRTGVSAELPDCRVYEQVTPAVKGGAEGVIDSSRAEASPSGDRVAYEGLAPFPGAGGNTLYAEHLSTYSKASGWQTTELVPRKTTPEPGTGYLPVTYQAFSTDLSEVVLHVPDQILAEGATPGAQNLFIRREDGSYGLINDATPMTTAPAECDGECATEPAENEVKFAGATANLEHTLYLSNAIYNSQTPQLVIPIEGFGEVPINFNIVDSLYESPGGSAHLVSYLPNGQPEEEGLTAGSGGNELEQGRGEHVISENGSRIVFDATSNEGTTQEEGQHGDTEVYDRIDGSSTLELSGPAAGASPTSSSAAKAEFWAASANGSRVFFTSEQELTTDSTATSGKSDLYVYEFPTEAAAEGSLVDLTVDANAGEAAGVLGVLDASENGEYVYFVAEGALASGATAGAPNLYMVHNDQAPVFIATLNAGTDTRDWTARATELEAYVTPDGQHVQFMSTEDIATENFPTGYDSAGFSEVYEYTAPTAAEEANAETGGLVCGSCQPSGVAPTGDAVTAGANASSTEAERQESADTDFYHVRSLSNSGARMFFTSTPIESENSTDLAVESPSPKLYEYERDGIGTCTDAKGCVDLISSPSNTSADYFLDASENGEDVFFSTESQLAATDEDQARDVYDATEGGEPVLAPHEAECKSGCRTAGPSVQAGPGLTSTVVGPAENVLPKVEATKSKQKKHKATTTKAQLLAKALKKCKQKQAKRKRKLCEVTARKRYAHKGAKAKAKSKQKRAKHAAHASKTGGDKR